MAQECTFSADLGPTPFLRSKSRQIRDFDTWPFLEVRNGHFARGVCRFWPFLGQQWPSGPSRVPEGGGGGNLGAETLKGKTFGWFPRLLAGEGGKGEVCPSPATLTP